MPLNERLRIYLVADYTGRTESAVEWAIREALAGGITALQYRDKTASPSAVHLERVGRLRQWTRDHGVLLIVNDDLDLAMQAGADGVHLGPQDMDPEIARQQAPPGLVIGGSAGTVDRALELERAGVDYLGVGAIFEARGTKPDASLPRGPGIVTEIRRKVSLPIVAIGGLTVHNAGRVFAAGACGVAVVRAVLDAEDPRGVVARLLAVASRSAISLKGGA